MLPGRLTSAKIGPKEMERTDFACLRAVGMAVAVGLALTGAPEPARAAGCKLALVLALDISSSVNDREYDLQRLGLVRAFRTPAVIDAILTPKGAGIAATAFEWSGYSQQDVVIPWTMLDSEARIRDFADTLAAHRRPFSDLATALGKAVEYGAHLFADAPPCARRVLDVSGDGENNDGVGPEYFRARGVLAGITINGLVVQGAVPDPAPYYRDHVIQGPGAFLALARNYGDYPSVIIGKLLREIDQDLILGAQP
jgi:Ca-activated chloride channel family protein